MNSEYLEINSDWRVIIYRLIFAILGWVTIIIGQIRAGFSIASYKFFTMQTNLMVLIWFTMVNIFYKNYGLLQKILGLLKGAFTLYITVTFIVFAIVLEPLYNPTGFELFSNIVLHYIIPISFILDWIITEKSNYKWKYLFYWLIYPVFYLVFAITHGTLTGNYIYPFLDINLLGIGLFLLVVGILFIVFIGLSALYIGINRKLLSKQ
ncbi:MAG: hypothetical protein GF329_14090 [Candidatus Lokiarchaeota archaeon]|nr:hypothetical protein [Candidatus Lokiarchaeota archaeon]